ncbi:hypothetical protein ACVWYS_000532 [Arthrobacter sp. TE12231]
MKTAGTHNGCRFSRPCPGCGPAQIPHERSGGTFTAAAPVSLSKTRVPSSMGPRPADDGGSFPGRTSPDQRTAPRQARTLFPSGVLGEMLFG